eukprot:Phypoly_transcript_07145.p2 GENE.Phypoly_transcript_07145~~Phypoly_transcript_07145.p2  ORF type:complete len:184 (+),score=40.32 Phypoly_transcript_07145:1094-1645(+)
MVNKKGFEEGGMLVWWINPNSGEPRNTVKDHSALLWDEYKAPDAATVKVTIKSMRGINMEKKDKNGSSDPYVEIGQMKNDKWNQLYKTSTVKHDLNPKWPGLNETIEVDTAHPLLFIANDKDLLGHDFMGSWMIDVKVLQFLKEKYNKKEFTILQKYSGLQTHQKGSEWKLVTTGALEIVIEL